jgi:excisionase family DNA binding protein
MPTVMTLEEVAAYLHVHQSTLYRLLKAQSIPAFKLGSDWRFNRESIDQWIAQGEEKHAASGAGERPRAQSGKGSTRRRVKVKSQ